MRPHNKMAVFLVIAFISFPPSVLAESGSGSDDSLDDFVNCTSQMTMAQNSLACHFDEGIAADVKRIQLCDSLKRNCVKLSNRTEDGKTFHYVNLNPVSVYNICITLKSKMKLCDHIKLKDIIKPFPPWIANATFVKSINAAEIRIETHYANDYLDRKLVFQVEIRGNGTVQKTDILYQSLRVEGKYLEPNTLYHVRARAKPQGDYFQGFWSDWSDPVAFRTTKLEVPEKGGPNILLYVLIISVVVLLLITIVVVVQWSTEIKASIWPSIPNPKNTLGHMYKKPGKDPVTSFNPEAFRDLPIHSVDALEVRVVDESLLLPPGPQDLPPGRESSPRLTLSGSSCPPGEAQPMLVSRESGQERSQACPAARTPGECISVPTSRRDEAYVTMSSFNKNQ
nr:PREDICTED: interleukin-7 receptor subunit alpha [Lepisosteus oculatus]